MLSPARITGLTGGEGSLQAACYEHIMRAGCFVEITWTGKWQMRQFVSLVKKCFPVHIVVLQAVVQWCKCEGVEIGRDMRWGSVNSNWTSN